MLPQVNFFFIYLHSYFISFLLAKYKWHVLFQRKEYSEIGWERLVFFLKKKKVNRLLESNRKGFESGERMGEGQPKSDGGQTLG